MVAIRDRWRLLRLKVVLTKSSVACGGSFFGGKGPLFFMETKEKLRSEHESIKKHKRRVTQSAAHILDVEWTLNGSIRVFYFHFQERLQAGAVLRSQKLRLYRTRHFPLVSTWH